MGTRGAVRVRAPTAAAAGEPHKERLPHLTRPSRGKPQGVQLRGESKIRAARGIRAREERPRSDRDQIADARAQRRRLGAGATSTIQSPRKLLAQYSEPYRKAVDAAENLDVAAKNQRNRTLLVCGSTKTIMDPA
jgi:hypothetical protein